MTEKGKGLPWSHQMGLQMCLELMRILFECTPLHEQGPMCDIIVLMEVGVRSKIDSKDFWKTKTNALILNSSYNAS
jgi:hypothetical protein